MYGMFRLRLKMGIKFNVLHFENLNKRYSFQIYNKISNTFGNERSFTISYKI